MRLPYLLVAALLSAAPLLLSQASAGKDRYPVAGRVLNATTGEPLNRALVELVGAGQFIPTGMTGSPPQVPSAYRQMTDASGAFRFADVVPGSYMFRVTKPHFSNEYSRGPRPQFVVDAPRENVEVRLPPLAAVEGTIQDRDGQPLPNVAVELTSSQIENGRRTFWNRPTTHTDDRGYYRFADLAPGPYYVKAQGRTGFRYFRGERPAAVDAYDTFAPVYFGGGDTIAAATPFNLQPGQTLSADFRLAFQPSFKIRGTLANIAAGLPIVLELRQGVQDTVQCRIAMNLGTGQFEIDDVTPGTYRLRARQIAGERQSFAETDVQVSGADVTNINLPLLPLASLTFHTACTPATANCTGHMLLHGWRADEQQFVGVQPDSDSVIHRIIPGEYEIEVLPPPGGYVSSLRSGNTDLLAAGRLVVAPGATPAPIEVTISTDGGTMKVSPPSSGGSTTLDVLVVPDTPSARRPRAVRFVAPATAQLDGLAPGDYTIYTGSDLMHLEYANPEVLRTLTASARAHITAGQTTTVTLTSVQP